MSKIPHAVVLDIGANVAQHSLALSPLAAVVHAFEPYPPRLASLRANLARNLHLRIIIHPIALGAADKDAPFRLPVTGEWAGVQFDPTGALRFPMRNADLYLKQNGIDRIDLIKLDVDGNELDILISLRSHIERLRPTLVVEADRTIASLAEVLPNDYELLGNSHGRLRRIDAHFQGNIFCISREHMRHLRQIVEL